MPQPPRIDSPPPYSVYDQQDLPTYDNATRDSERVGEFLSMPVQIASRQVYLPPLPPAAPSLPLRCVTGAMQSSLICNAIAVPACMVTMGIGVAAFHGVSVTATALFVSVPIVSSIAFMGCSAGLGVIRRQLRRDVPPEVEESSDEDYIVVDMGR